MSNPKRVCLLQLFSYLLFFLTKKVTKKSRRFDGEHSCSSKFSSDESPVGTVFYSKVFNSVNPLRAVIRFLKALNFSLNDCRHRML